MSKENSSASAGGIGFFGLLGIAFIVLKLLKQIDWPWIWVLAPLWGPIALVTGIFIIIGLYYLVKYLRREADEARRKKAGMSSMEWAMIKFEKKKEKRRKKLGDTTVTPAPKSKWQERLEEMQARQKRNQ